MLARSRFVCVLLALSLVLAHGASQSILADDVELEVLGSALWSGFNASEIVGNYAFVVMMHGMWVFDISTPSSPAKVAELYLGGGHGILIKDGYAIVATNYHGLKIVDISDPLHPSIVGDYPYIDDDFASMALDGNVLYLGYNGPSIEVVDVSNVLAPSQITVLGSGGLTRQIVISGDYAYIATYSDLNIVDISDPSNPSVIATYDDPQYVFGVQINGNYAYLNCYYTIEVIDISDPHTPAFQYSYDTPNNIFSLTLHDDFLYYGVAPNEIQMLIVSDPALPVYGGSYAGPPMVDEMRFTGGYCCVSYAYSFGLYSYGPDGGIGLVGSHGCGDRVNEVQVAVDVAYVANEGDGLQILDVSDPADPEIIGNYPTTSYTRGVMVIDGIAYLANGYEGLVLVDVSDPANPTYIGDWLASPSALVEQLAVQGDYAYLAANNSGLFIIDVSDPASPSDVGAYDPPGTAWDLQVRGDYAYVASYSSLQVIDISVPSTPGYEGSVTINNCTNVTLAGDYALLSCGSSGLRIVDISNPAAPALIDFLNTGGSVNSLYLHGNTGYLANGGAGVLLLDVTDPESPVSLGDYLTPSGPRHVFYDGEFIYAAEHYGFEILGEVAPFVPGDIDGSGTGPDIADLVYLVNYMFNGGPPPPVIASSDVNGDCTGPDIADLVYLVNYMFNGGPAPIPCP